MSGNNETTGVQSNLSIEVPTSIPASPPIKKPRLFLSYPDTNDAKTVMPWVYLFVGDLRDGLTMINMQCIYLKFIKKFSEKQVGILYFAFGLAQFMSLAPAGYIYDYTSKKRNFLIAGTLGTSILTVATVLLAQPQAENIGFLIVLKIFQGMLTSLIPPGLNSITQGIVGYHGMTFQVSRNKMMNHLGTVTFHIFSGVLAYNLYPNMGYAFIISPIMMAFVIVAVYNIHSNQIDDQAARGLVMSPSTLKESEDASSNYSPPLHAGAEALSAATAATATTPAAAAAATAGSCTPLPDTAGANCSDADSGISIPPVCIGVCKNIGSPITSAYDPSSFRIPSPFGGTLHADPSYTLFEVEQVQESWPLKKAPCEMLRDPILAVFVVIIFLFHVSNTSVLPLVMQSLKVENDDSPFDSIILPGMCICISQSVMIFVAKACGDYSLIIGRKPLFLTGLYSLPIRCFLVAFLINYRLEHGDSIMLRIGLLSTEIFDGIGAGFYFTLFVLVTSDISASTGRFSLTLGFVVGAVALGGTVSGYLGEALAEDLGYQRTFTLIGFFSFIPALMYTFLMPETCPDSPFMLARQTIPNRSRKPLPKLV